MLGDAEDEEFLKERGAAFGIHPSLGNTIILSWEMIETLRALLTLPTNASFDDVAIRASTTRTLLLIFHELIHSVGDADTTIFSTEFLLNANDADEAIRMEGTVTAASELFFPQFINEIGLANLFQGQYPLHDAYPFASRASGVILGGLSSALAAKTEETVYDTVALVVGAGSGRSARVQLADRLVANLSTLLSGDAKAKLTEELLDILNCPLREPSAEAVEHMRQAVELSTGDDIVRAVTQIGEKADAEGADFGMAVVSKVMDTLAEYAGSLTTQTHA
jgi:hypothetical protein